MTPNPRVRMPTTAKAGEVIEVRTLISHEMETGQRKDQAGKAIPRRIIKRFVARFNSREVLRIDLYPAISSNPFLAFWLKVPETGTFTFEWLDDDGSVYLAEQMVTVS